ncbi:MAG: hypothetical protein WCV81_01145 [Microgenomates group bacterium]|jgi:hypothetical protein
MEAELEVVSTKWKHWHYKNTFLLILSLIIFFLLADTPFVKNIISYIGNFGYLGAFFAGILFVSVFTVAPASIVLFYLAESLNPLGIALAAGTGGMIGDYLIFKYLKDEVFGELKPILIHHEGKLLQKIFRTPYFAWIVPIIGAVIIMSPFPDEVGIGLMGVSKMKTWQLMGLLYLLDVVGIFLIVIAARSF